MYALNIRNLVNESSYKTFGELKLSRLFDVVRRLSDWKLRPLPSKRKPGTVGGDWFGNYIFDSPRQNPYIHGTK